MSTGDPLDSPRARLYQLEGNEEWHVLVRHIELQEGFSVVLLIVPERAVALLCLETLRQRFAGTAKQVAVIEIVAPNDLAHLAGSLVNPEHLWGPATVFAQAAVSSLDPGFAQWRDAWYSGMARLNQFRNSLPKQMQGTLILVGCPWVKAVVREAAPDLYSIRALVIEISPVRPEGQVIEWAQPSVPLQDAPDPEQALLAAGRARGVPGRELELADLLLRAAEGLEARLDWERAETALREGVALREQHADPGDLAAALSRLSSLLQVRGKLSEAREHAERALRLAERSVGTDLVAVRRSNLASILGDLGEPGEARKQIELALESDLRQFGPDHPNVAVHRSNLANILLELGEHGEARKQIDLALESELRQFGPDHPTIATSRNNLAHILEDLGERAEALRQFDLALEILRKTMPPGHPHIQAAQRSRDRLARELPR